MSDPLFITSGPGSNDLGTDFLETWPISLCFFFFFYQMEMSMSTSTRSLVQDKVSIMRYIT